MSKSGDTAIHRACQKNRPDILNYLIEKGANIESTRVIQTKSYDLGAQTPLFVAVLKQRVDCVKILLNNGADISGLQSMIQDDFMDPKENSNNGKANKT